MNASIMVIDDSSDNLRFMAKTLNKEGYEDRPLIKGALAIEAAIKFPPDLILLDIKMPEMDGYEVCRFLKKDEITKKIPIIFISGLDEVFDKVKAFSEGGVDYITKPFQKEEILLRIKTHLKISYLQKDLEKKNEELQKAFDNIKKLQGLLPICSNCKKIRDDTGGWQEIDLYIQKHSQVDFSHGICNECAKKLYPDIMNELGAK